MMDCSSVYTKRNPFFPKLFLIFVRIFYVYYSSKSRKHCKYLFVVDCYHLCRFSIVAVIGFSSFSWSKAYCLKPTCIYCTLKLNRKFLRLTARYCKFPVLNSFPESWPSLYCPCFWQLPVDAYIPWLLASSKVSFPSDFCSLVNPISLSFLCVCPSKVPGNWLHWSC